MKKCILCKRSFINERDLTYHIATVHDKKRNGRPKGQLSLSDLFGFVIAFVIYVVGLYPIVNNAVQTNYATFDPITQSVIVFMPLVFLLAIILGLFHYAFGRRPTQYGFG